LIDALEEQNEPGLSTLLEQRKTWVESLKAGVNPLTPEVMVALREQ
jgi:hypothetical protein